MRSSSIRYLNTESYIGLAMFTIIGFIPICFLQTLCQRVQREFSLNLPNATRCYANIHIFSIRPKASGVIILCPTGKICVVRHVVVVIQSLNILIINKEWHVAGIHLAHTYTLWPIWRRMGTPLAQQGQGACPTWARCLPRMGRKDARRLPNKLML